MFYENVKDLAPLHLKDRGVKHTRISEAQKVYESYEFKQEIGHGSFGVVVLAIEKSNAKQWAIKIVHKNTAGTRTLLEVDREIRILKVVDHPNIIHLERIYESPKKIYMVLELCETELHGVYCKKRPFTDKVTKKVIGPLADAVSYLHKNDIVHRDVKMENILLVNYPGDKPDDYRIKLTDFGLSVFKSGVGIESLMTDYCGTVAYMPPEILQRKTYSELCDVWAIGVIMYAMLYGRLPFYDKNQDTLVEQICTQEPDYDIASCSPDAVDLMQCIMEKNPVRRITASQIKEHQWLDPSTRVTSGLSKRHNIVDMMKEFRRETAPSPGRVSKGMSLVSDTFNDMMEVLNKSAPTRSSK